MDVNNLTGSYDFREEIVAFQTDDPIDRHFIYQAVGIAQEDKEGKRAEQNLAYQEAKDLYEAQTMRDDSPGAEADNCRFLQEVFSLLYAVNPDVAISCDTMNSISTTMNKLFSFHKRELGISGRVSKRKSVVAYRHHRDMVRNIIQVAHGDPSDPDCAKNFLRAAYTIGNFVPTPAGCNGPRGFRNQYVEDYWDLTLHYIYKWYLTTSDEYIKRIVGLSKAAVYRSWLESFENWDAFIQKNFMQPFVEGGGVRYSYEPEAVPKKKDHFGPPKALWKGHLEYDAVVLPQNEQQISEFFTNAARAVNARGELLIEALKRSCFMRVKSSI